MKTRSFRTDLISCHHCHHCHRITSSPFAKTDVGVSDEQKELQPWWEGEDHLREAKNFGIFRLFFLMDSYGLPTQSRAF